MADDLAALLGGGPESEAVGPARPVGAAAAVEAVPPPPSFGHGGARLGAGRKPKGAGARSTRAKPAPEAPPVDPATLKLLQDQLLRSYELVLSLLAFAPVVFEDAERGPVGDGIVYCVEAYLPAGITKHVPALVLAAVSVKAIARAREHKRDAVRKEGSGK